MAFGNRMWGNEVVMNYLRTGEYRHWAPVNKVTRWTVIPALASRPGVSIFFNALELQHNG